MPALLGSGALLGWMSSRHARSWVWCSFCLQGKQGSSLSRQWEWYRLPQGYQLPNFIVAFPSCSLRHLVVPPPPKMPSAFFQVCRVGENCPFQCCFLNGRTCGKGSLSDAGNCVSMCPLVTWGKTPQAWEKSSLFHPGTAWKRFLLC